INKYRPESSEQEVREITRLLTDAEYEVISQPEESSGKDLAIAGGNMYEKGLTGAEVATAIANGLKSGLNCRIVRNTKGAPTCELQALSNPNLNIPTKNALTKVVASLKKALPYALTPTQKSQITHLIRYFEKGDVEEFRQMNIQWVKDGTKSKVDFMMGYVEVYADYLNQIGSWESYVQIIDPKMTSLSVNLAKNAQGFEDEMPYGQFKKKFPENYSPPALMVYYFQELSTFHSGGYNLPNFDDIRRDVGAKNIIRLDLPGMEKDKTTLKIRREMFEEFLPKSKVDGVMQDWLAQRRAMVLLHEIIGHGSGTYDVTKYGEKEDPVGALGSLGSALEEQRADQAGLVFAADPRLVKVGYYRNADEAQRVRNAMYDAYLGHFLQRVSKEQSLSEAHQRGHWMLINMLMEKGVVVKESKNGGPATDQDFVLAVTDYNRFHKVSTELLGELQRIKANRDEAALKNIFAKYAPLNEIKASWLQAVIKRGQKLAINAGSIEQPWQIKNGSIVTFGGETLESIAPYLNL
ncbi:MAG: hypothetical protein IT289_08625, partial [Oligoflexia bacterium]|nr:hypothetical protein [Oligoflexia bacterium]